RLARRPHEAAGPRQCGVHSVASRSAPAGGGDVVTAEPGSIPILLTPGAHDDRANVAWAGEESAEAGLHRVSEGDGSVRLRPHARESRRVAPLSGPGRRSRIPDAY